MTTDLALLVAAALGVCFGFALGIATACTLIRWDDATPIGRK